MSIIARWRAVDPTAVRDRFRRFGLDVGPDGRIVLDGGWLEIVAAERADLRGAEQLEVVDGPPLGGAHVRAGAARLVAVGFGVIDLEAALAELGRTAIDLPPDCALGARAAGVAGESIVLLEATTEGRLAASLARFGPGPLAIYVALPAGLPTTGAVPVNGPFGPCVVLGGPIWGPHLIACDSAPESSSTIPP